jgi:hypothetical protein
MKFTTYSVYSTGRNWAEWLGEPVSEQFLTRENYHEPRWYSDEGRFLVLVHPSDDLCDDDERKALEIEESWMHLPDRIRHRVFWLVYSGGGYWQLRSRQPNVHFLRFQIGTVINDADKSRFRLLCRALKKDEEVGASTVWDLLYPDENVHAATLLAILAADEVGVDISSAVAAALNDSNMLATAHREFAAHSKSEAEPANLASWLADLRRQNYSSVRTQLREVFGGAPD